MYKSIAKRYGAPSNAKPLKRNLKPVPEGNKGLAKLPEPVRNKMGFMRMKDGSEAPGGPFPRFCGGKSKPFKRNGGGGKKNPAGKSKMVDVEYTPADGSDPYMISVGADSNYAKYAKEHGSIPGGIYGLIDYTADMDWRRSDLTPQQKARREYDYIVANPGIAGGKGSPSYLASTQRLAQQAGVMQRKKGGAKRKYKKKK